MLKVGNANMAVITDRRLVKEVIDRKSAIYSHRPHSYVSHELITKSDHLLVMHYGNKWRIFRRLVHQHLMESMVDSHHVDIVNAEAIQMVRDYLMKPKDHMLHPKRYSNSITNSIGMSQKPLQCLPTSTHFHQSMVFAHLPARAIICSVFTSSWRSGPRLWNRVRNSTTHTPSLATNINIS